MAKNRVRAFIKSSIKKSKEKELEKSLLSAWGDFDSVS